jgi:hypothetical protein
MTEEQQLRIFCCGNSEMVRTMKSATGEGYFATTPLPKISGYEVGRNSADRSRHAFL